MKVVKQQVLKPLMLMSGVATRTTAAPILETVLIVPGNNNEVVMLASDGEMQLRMKVGTVANGEWVAGSINGKKLHDIVRNVVDDGEISLSPMGEDMKTIVKAGKSKFTLRGFPHKDFPVMSFDDKSAVSFSVKEGDLKKLIKLAANSTAVNDVSRYFLNGVYLDVMDGKLFVVGTDGHRMSMSHVEIEDETVTAKANIFRKIANELVKVLGDSDNLVKVSISSNMAKFEIGNFEFITRLIEGDFPQYKRVVPDYANFGTSILSKVEDLKRSISRVGFISELSNHVLFETTVDGLVISSQTGTAAAAPDDVTDIVECELKVSGKGSKVLFNNSLLGELVGNVSSEKIKLMLDDETRPVVIRFDNSEVAIENNYIGILMPVRP